MAQQLKNKNHASHVGTVELMRGYTIPRIIKGGWQLAGGHGPISEEQAITDMLRFAQAGITAFDCADIYTGVEEKIGTFLRQYRKMYGEKANDIHVHTKFVPDLDDLPLVNMAYAERIIDRSLRRLSVERIDLVQYHWWDYDIPRYVEVAQYLYELKKKGKIRAIGVTNFDTKHLEEIVSAGIPVCTNQVQYSVLDIRPEKALAAFTQRHGLSLLCYGAVAGGFLSERYLGGPEPSEPMENRSLTKYKLIIDDFGGWDLFQEMLRMLKRIAEKHGVSIGDVAIRYVLEKPAVGAVVVGARNGQHLSNLLKCFSFSLDGEDKDRIANVQMKSPGLSGDIYGLEREKGGKHARIMKYNLNKEGVR